MRSALDVVHISDVELDNAEDGDCGHLLRHVVMAMNMVVVGTQA